MGVNKFQSTETSELSGILVRIVALVNSQGNDSAWVGMELACERGLHSPCFISLQCPVFVGYGRYVRTLDSMYVCFEETSITQNRRRFITPCVYLSKGAKLLLPI